MNTERHICTVCNYIYEKLAGDEQRMIAPGTSFDDLPDNWKCPDCAASKEMFQPCSCVSLQTYEVSCPPTGDLTAPVKGSPASAAKELLNLASSEQTKFDHNRSFAVSVTYLGPEIRNLVENMHDKKVPAEKDILSVFFEGAGIKLIREYSINYYWFWRVIAQAAARTSTPRISGETVQAAVNEIRNSYAKHFDLSKAIDQLTPAEIALWTAHGIVVLKHWPDHQYSVMLNPIFRTQASSLSSETSVGKLVLERPSRARVFDKFGIDYCCGGGKSLQEACKQKDVNVETILRELAQSDLSTAGEPSRDWAQASMTELVDHIEASHHAYAKHELPRLSALAEKVRNVHEKRHPELVDVQEIFESLKAGLTSHITKEESVVFPACRKWEAETGSRRLPPPGLIDELQTMEQEHENAGNALKTMRKLTNNFTPPDDACNSYRALLAGLSDFEDDIHRHVNKENYALHPRIRMMAEELLATQAV